MSHTKKNATYASILCSKEQAISASLHKTLQRFMLIFQLDPSPPPFHLHIKVDI